MSLRDEYQQRYHVALQHLVKPLERWIIEHVAGIPRIDRISVRAKDVDRFVTKAERTRDNATVYTEPLVQIQDQIAARIVVFYTNDVECVSERILKYFMPVEEAVRRPQKDEEFGYFGKHFILPLPQDIVPKEIALEDAPTCFELQIKTLYQHAWSEAEHDVGYKPTKELTSDHRRALAFLAAQSWGADKVFDELARELVPDYAEWVVVD